MNGHHRTPWRFPPREHLALEHLLLGELRDMLNEPPDPEATRWLLAVIDTLIKLLPDRFAHEEDGGYLSEVTEEFPTWDSEVVRLRRERIDLYRRLRQLRNQVRHTGRSDAISNRDAGELHEWIDWLERHDREETDLLQTAVNLEIGGEG